MDYIKQKLSLVPNLPGCYLMKNKDGAIIYVGKAKKLKNRVSSYFRGTHTGKTAKLVSEIADFEYVVVGSETESLILEMNLIKEHDPKYNILLRDDKSYPYIELTSDKVPKLSVVRSLNKKKHKGNLYGPYPNVGAARNTVNLLNRMYPLRKCNTYNRRPCLYYHIHECLGYCTHKVDQSVVAKMRDEIIKFLKGDHTYVTERITKEMNDAALSLNFEKAQELKELLDYIKVTLVKQKVEVQDNVDRDVFGYYIYKGYISIQVFFIRGGKVLERHSKIATMMEDEGEELTNYIAKFYSGSFLLPKEVLVPEIVDYNTLSEFLSVSVKAPQKGVKKKLVDMAKENAKISLLNQFEMIEKDQTKTSSANEELRNILKLDSLYRIELFDNSHLFGTYSVSGMVVFKDGKPSKNDYRKFKIMEDSNDEYGMMKEVIYRRYFRILRDNLEKPDLIIVDGGLGQIHVAREILKSLGMNIPVVGLKKDNKHNTSALLAFDPIVEIPIDKKSNLFYFLERMQDEVHDFTIAYHRQIRSKGAVESILDNVAGIGSVRKKQLLKKYKTITKIKEAGVEEIGKIVPSSVALELMNVIDEYLKNNKELKS